MHLQAACMRRAIESVRQTMRTRLDWSAIAACDAMDESGMGGWGVFQSRGCRTLGPPAVSHMLMDQPAFLGSMRLFYYHGVFNLLGNFPTLCVLCCEPS